MRRWLLLFIALALTSLSACKSGRPSEDRCRQAVENIRALTGLEKSDIGADPDAVVRSCRAQSTKESVRCAIEAKSLTDLEACELGVDGL